MLPSANKEWRYWEYFYPLPSCHAKPANKQTEKIKIVLVRQHFTMSANTAQRSLHYTLPGWNVINPNKQLKIYRKIKYFSNLCLLFFSIYFYLLLQLFPLFLLADDGLSLDYISCIFNVFLNALSHSHTLVINLDLFDLFKPTLYFHFVAHLNLKWNILHCL